MIQSSYTIMKVYKSSSLEDTKNIALSLSDILNGDELLCLNGDLASGKTTFLQYLALSLGVKGNILSPTFVIRSDHKGQNDLWLYHFDLYRLDFQNEIEPTGFFDVLGKGIVAVEWANKFPEVFSDTSRYDINFRILSDTERSIEICKY